MFPIAKKESDKTNSIRELLGVDEDITEKLEGEGITTTQEFLDMCVTRNDRNIISDILEIHEGDILTMANMADLLRISSVTPEWAWLLEKVGVDTVPELSQRNPEHLYEAIEEYDIAFLEDVEEKPGLEHLKEWVKTAEEMDRILKY